MANVRGPADAAKWVLEKERQVIRVHQAETERHDDLEEQVVDLSNGLHMQKVKIEHVSEQLGAKLWLVKSELEQSIYRHRTERHTAETKLDQLADRFAAEGFGCIAEEKQLQEKSVRYTKDIQGEICHLYSDIQQARNFRVEKGKKLAAGVSAKLEEIHEAVAAERRIREDSEHTLLELLGQMGEKLQNELDTCRRDREKSAEHLVAIMESASRLLEKGQKSGAKAAHDRLQVESDAKAMASSAAAMTKRPSIVARDGALGRSSMFF